MHLDSSMDVGIYAQNAVTTLILLFGQIIVSPLSYLDPVCWLKCAILRTSVFWGIFFCLFLFFFSENKDFISQNQLFHKKQLLWKAPRQLCQPLPKKVPQSSESTTWKRSSTPVCYSLSAFILKLKDMFNWDAVNRSWQSWKWRVIPTK